jgi:hypothetical protein
LDHEGDSSGPDAGYVYDLYYTSIAGSDGLVNLDNLSVHPLYQSNWEYYNPEDSSDISAEEEDEDDSNDENNWRNDYPDSDHRFGEFISIHIKRQRVQYDWLFKAEVLNCPLVLLKIK